MHPSCTGSDPLPPRFSIPFRADPSCPILISGFTISDLNATSSASSGPGAFWRRGLLFFLAVMALSLPQAALLPLLDRDEPRFAEASREMRQSGNFIVATFKHATRYA